ncbi:restriction endonuclease subunit S [Lactobacillus delbrueckii]|uniref:restriction endonuclease subunit S n=1 Tax=Lactobacillus delbrueckii TaxID=1584 RepID=UPI000674B5F3
MPGHAGTGGRDVIFAWEQRKLGDVANFSKGTGYSKSDLKGTGSPIILYGRLYTKYETIIRNVDSFVVPKSGSVFSKGGEVIVPGSGETAEDISIASVVEPAGILLGGDLNIIYPNSDLDPTFLAITISNGKPHFDMARRAQGKSIVHLHNADLKHISLKTPNLSEQKRISKIFEVLDQTITLHEEKKQQLKCLKSALLQKMFANKNKSGDPDVRFKGFDERWERHILNDLAIFNPKGTLPTSFEYVDLGSVIGVEMISHKTISKFDAPSRAQRLAQVGDLFYQTVRPYQQNNYLFDNKDNAYVFSTGYAQLRPLIDGYFLLCLVQTKSFVRKVMNACTGTSYPAINSQDLAQIGVNIPINSKEQRLIGNLYKVIDNLITLYQQKLDDLNTIKQSLLQKMFI